ncbi:MAG: indolepyruvate ferredoxin oxidoreductase family protein [SAR324 cluster bacterium]|nr:indolepyruvate ferredoxin oxidoreductase family protein [SAR324 cluster bacterium]MBL7035680.1 indolepyruvate ferredoxin oxidoreductase family protein [SAR324 cluster bacterium]
MSDMENKSVSLEDKYSLRDGYAFMTGIQALVRLPMIQQELDLNAGLKTAGYISGYRGSPLGSFDLQLAQNKELLDEHHVKFQPGVNEDLAATALWGTQQAELRGEGKFDGIFGIWYGKGPGVDRSGDVLRHANYAGTSKFGGVLTLMGDDHTAESSTVCNQSEFAMVDALIPVLNPSGVQDIYDLGIYGWALSRFSGCWVGLKCLHDTVEATASIRIDVERLKINIPEDFVFPADGVNIRFPDTPHAQDRRIHEYKLDAVRAFCRANKLDRIIWSGGKAKIGIVTVGKSYLDTRLAFEELGIDESEAERLGVRLYKVAMPWPLEPEGILEFAEGLDLIIVVEEKRALIEPQIKEMLYDASHRPQVIGKTDETGEALFRTAGALDPNHIAATVGRRILNFRGDADLKNHLHEMESRLDSSLLPQESMVRLPYFCSGCPHNTSTVVPEGSIAMAGIGCHYMVQWMERDTLGFTHMGAEGANWIGQSPFTTRKHIFQNIGDGTYFHSGIMAIRAAVSAGINITYKILFNDAVAMTGGQGFDGPMTVQSIIQQMFAEGAKKVTVVSDDPDKFTRSSGVPANVKVYNRRDLDVVQRELREIEGVTVLIYEQVCAAEKRRRRKRGIIPDPPRRIYINDEVCEGCGDCGLKSNCVSVLPLETQFGRKRVIDQSACNKDYSCVNGLCPSFVSVIGGKLRKNAPSSSLSDEWTSLPEPLLPEIKGTYNIVMTGVGGTGIVTIGALLGMAAHIEQKGVGILDMIGLAQKGGAVLSHLRIGNSPDDIHSPRIASQGADLVIGGDLVVTGGEKTLAVIKSGQTKLVVNSYELITGDFTRNADLLFPSLKIKQTIQQVAETENCEFLDASRLATALIGDTIATNMFMLGFAFQRGLIPLERSSIEQAIDLNGMSVASNKQAFLWGRRTAHDGKRVRELTASIVEGFRLQDPPEGLDELIQHRADVLSSYQNKAYAKRYLQLVERVRTIETDRLPGQTELTAAVARYYFKLLAYKDEYEVARLYTNGDFMKNIRGRFEGDYKLKLHFAPPLFSSRDTHTGEPLKSAFGAWIFPAMKILTHFKFLRGTAFDPFAKTKERRMERKLILDYELTVKELLRGLTKKNHHTALEIAKIPEQIRGFDLVKQRYVEDAKLAEQKLLEQFRNSVEITVGLKSAEAVG